MVLTSRRRGFTLVELLVVIVILGMLIGLMVPAVLRTRETARRSLCASNMRQIGIALNTYEEANGRLPCGAAVMKYPASNGQYAETWSIFSYLLPNMDMDTLYSRIKVRANYAPWEENAGGTATSKFTEIVRQTPLPILRCASSGVSTDQQELPPFKGFLSISAATPIKGAVTNYKVMGDPFRAGLGITALRMKTSSATGPNGNTSPDGVFYPTSPSGGRRLTDISDGLQYTIFAVETIEPQYSRWMMGSEVTLAGLPYSEDDSTNGVKLEQITIPELGTTAIRAPTGFNGKFDEDSAVTPEFRTYLSYEYDKEDKYYDDKTDGQSKIKYGPSSRHGSTVNHLFGDGRVHAINTAIDVALYYFMITINRNEPFPASETNRWQRQ